MNWTGHAGHEYHNMNTVATVAATLDMKIDEDEIGKIQKILEEKEKKKSGEPRDEL